MYSSLIFAMSCIPSLPRACADCHSTRLPVSSHRARWMRRCRWGAPPWPRSSRTWRGRVREWHVQQSRCVVGGHSQPACLPCIRSLPAMLRPPPPHIWALSPPVAVAYNFVGVPIAAGALLPEYGIALSPSLAGGMMALSSIAVVTNSISLRWTLGSGSSDGSSSSAGSSSNAVAAAPSGSQAHQLGGSTS